jgi:hypothetical protein
MTWAASVVVAATTAQVTSAYNVGTSMLPWDRSYRNKMQEGMRMHE